MSATVVPSAHYTDIHLIRQWIFRRMLQVMLTAKTGHLGACCSSTDLLTALYFGDILRYDSADSRHPLRDYVLNRGHLGPLKYTIGALIGWLDEEELNGYRQFGTRLAGHEDMNLTPGIDMSPNGSLGMILSYAAGLRIGMGQSDQRVWCFLGDGEEQEGNVSEAARHIGHLQMPNIITIVDQNGGQLSTRTQHTDSAYLEDLWLAYKWTVLRIHNGHNLEQILRVYQQAIRLAASGPVAIIARTVKGYGIPGADEDYCGFHVYHNAAEPGETVRHTADLPALIDTLPVINDMRVQPRALPRTLKKIYSGAFAAAIPEITINPPTTSDSMHSIYDIEERVLKKIKAQIGERLFILTSDYPPRCFVYDGGSKELLGEHYFNVGIREQHMTALAHGIVRARPNALVVILCGDAFLYRHMDQINALAQAASRVVFYSVQAGLSGARNGETHQSSGQPGAILMMPGAHLEEPCTAQDFIDATNRATNFPGPTIIRLQKLKVPFSFGGERHHGYEVVAHSEHARGTLISAGMTSLETASALIELSQHSGQCWNLINITSLSDCEGFGAFIGGERLECFYNGNADVLRAVVLKELARPEFIRGLSLGEYPPTVCAHGFNFGRTGGIGDLLKHFQLNAKAIVAHLLEDNTHEEA